MKTLLRCYEDDIKAAFRAPESRQAICDATSSRSCTLKAPPVTPPPLFRPPPPSPPPSPPSPPPPPPAARLRPVIRACCPCPCSCCGDPSAATGAGVSALQSLPPLCLPPLCLPPLCLAALSSALISAVCLLLFLRGDWPPPSPSSHCSPLEMAGGLGASLEGRGSCGACFTGGDREG